MKKEKKSKIIFPEIENPQCSRCEKFCNPFDSYRPFGSQGPEGIEPLDEEYVCKKCWKEFKKEWQERFKAGGRIGDCEKSEAEMKAAKEYKLAWVSDGIGVLGTNYFLDGHQYYPQRVYNTFSKLPYWGWCKKCGAIRSGGYCSNKNCEDYPKWMKEPTNPLNQ